MIFCKNYSLDVKFFSKNIVVKKILNFQAFFLLENMQQFENLRKSNNNNFFNNSVVCKN
jgi:hypothetical protein